jgi:GNAT superfamily N-acetyltransferase
VRRAGTRDVERVAALWTELAEHHARLDPREQLRAGADGEIRRLLAAELADPEAVALLYERDARALGLCMARIERAPPIRRETARVEIGELFVRREARGAGVGRALVDAALAWARGRGVERVVVRVFEGNTDGRGFWRALGFGALMDVLERRL